MRITSATARLLILTLAIACVAMVDANAARVRRLSLAEVRDRASSIIVGEVVSRSARVGDAGGMVWTDYQVRVVESLRGSRSAGELTTLTFAGGQAGGLDLGVGGVPKLATGRRYVFFIDAREGRAVPTIGWGQGLFTVEQITGKTPGQALISMEGEPLEVREGKLTRGGRVSVSGGRLLPLAEQQKSKRLTVSRKYNGDGSKRTLSPRPNVAGTTARLATLSDLRAFVNGAMTEERAGRVVR